MLSVMRSHGVNGGEFLPGTNLLWRREAVASVRHRSHTPKFIFNIVVVVVLTICDLNRTRS